MYNNYDYYALTKQEIRFYITSFDRMYVYKAAYVTWRPSFDEPVS